MQIGLIIKESISFSCKVLQMEYKTVKGNQKKQCKYLLTETRQPLEKERKNTQLSTPFF